MRKFKVNSCKFKTVVFWKVMLDGKTVRGLGVEQGSAFQVS